MDLPYRYKVSDGQKPNPNFGKEGHPDCNKPALDAGTTTKKQKPEPTPTADTQPE